MIPDLNPLLRGATIEYIGKEPHMSWKNLQWSEPAVLRGIITALIAFAAAIGFSVSSEINGFAEALVPFLAFVIPLAQSLWTRAAVSSPKTVAAIRAAGPQSPGVADHAA